MYYGRYMPIHGYSNPPTPHNQPSISGSFLLNSCYNNTMIKRIWRVWCAAIYFDGLMDKTSHTLVEFIFKYTSIYASLVTPRLKHTWIPISAFLGILWDLLNNCSLQSFSLGNMYRESSLCCFILIKTQWLLWPVHTVMITGVTSLRHIPTTYTLVLFS